MTTPANPARIERLIVTREFARSFQAMRSMTRKNCLRVLARLMSTPESPMIRLTPLPSPEGYHELRVGYNDRAIVRFDGSAAILVAAFSFREVARWNAEVSRTLGDKGTERAERVGKGRNAPRDPLTEQSCPAAAATPPAPAP